MIIAAAYVRVSTDEQTDYSPSVQLEEILEFAKKQGWAVPKEFIFTDEGISGRNAKNRPAFQDMIRQARKKSNHIQYIIVHKYDRFARSKDDAVLYKALLKKDGVKVVSVKEPIPQDDKFAVIYESMLEAMAEYYSLNLSEEVKKTMRKKAELGEWQTAAPFGYRNENKTLVVEPKEADAVRFLFERYAEGVSMFELTHYLNDLGLRTHRGNLFEVRTVQYILHNPVYRGYVRWTPNEKMKRNFSNPNTIVKKGSWKPIISEELWQQVEERQQKEKRTYYPKKRPEAEGVHWLSGIVKCSACGRSLVVGAKYKHGGFQFQCGGYSHGQCKISHGISSRRLIPAIFQALEQVASDSNVLDNFHVYREMPNTDEISLYSDRLQKAKQRLKKAKEAYLAEVDTLEEYRINKRQIENDIAALETQIKDLHTQQFKPFDHTIFSEKIRCVIEILENKESTMEDKRAALHSIMEKIVYHKNTDTIELFMVDR